MRLTAVILIASLMQVSAAGFAQKISLSSSKTDLKTVLKEIKAQSNYIFLYRDNVLKNARPVTVKFNQIEFKDALDKVFEGQPLTYSINENTITIQEKKQDTFLERVEATLAYIDIRGRVTDSTGLALSNASIRIKGSKKAYVSDGEGKFSFSAEAGEEVSISYTGYKVYVFTVAHDMGYQNVVLHEDPQALKEVVVNTGYQRISKERSTGSFDYIDHKKFNEQVGSTILERLSAIASSVAFNKSSAGGDPVTGITIRGISTINGGRTPLIVVDNFPYNGDLANLNPNSVESITILKDAAASSIWGAKAGNGVIVITTKKGKYDQKMNISVNSNFSVVTKPDLSSIRQISSSDFINLEKQLFDLGAYSRKENDLRNRPALSPVVELLIKARDHQISGSEANAQIDAMRKYDLRDQFSKYIYRQGLNQQHALNINGGSQNVAYNFLGGYDKSIDNLDARSERITLTNENTFKPFKNIELRIGLNFTQVNNTNGRPAYGSIGGNGYPGLPIYSRLGNIDGFSAAVYRYRQPFIDTLGGGKLLDWKYYPLEDYKHSTIRFNQMDLVFKTGVTYRFGEHLKFIFDYQLEKQKSIATNVNDLQSYYTRDKINYVTQIPADGSSLIFPIPKGTIQNFSTPSLNSNQLRGQLNFDRTWGKSAIVALAGGELRSVSTQIRNNGGYGYDPNTSISIPVDYVSYFPSIINGSGLPISSFDTSKDLLNRFVSIFANAAYTYGDKYSLSASARRDASNIFGATTNNRWKPLWSTGVAWDIGKESFYHFSFLPYLKLRATYGYSGNVASNVIGVTTISYYGIDIYSQLPYSNFLSFNNPDLRWENIAMGNLGLDFSFKNGILSGSIEYYHKKTSDLYGPARVDYTTLPTAVVTKNVASTAAKGLDIQLKSKNIDREIKWFSELIFNWNKDRVLNYYKSDTTASQYAENSAALSPGGSNAIYGIYSYPWAGLNPKTGDPQGYLNGQVSTDYTAIVNSSYHTLIYKGPSSPRIYGSFSNTVIWKQFSLVVNIGYKLGYYFSRSSINYNNLVNNGVGDPDYVNRWQKPGDETRTNVPSFQYPLNIDRDRFYAGSSALIDKADNIRLNYLTLNYSPVLPAAFKSWGLSVINVHFNASNLGLLWTVNKNGIDPDNQFVKSPRQFSIGLNASF